MKKANVRPLSDVIGKQGENIFELAITDYKQFPSPLFRPAFLGDNWPTIDYYVELLGVRGTSPFFLVQVKSTAVPFSQGADVLEINADKAKCEKLYKLPGPTYIVGVHVPTHKAYILSVHSRPTQGVYRIPLKYELTPANLKMLHKEVRDFWKSFPHKPTRSKFT